MAEEFGKDEGVKVEEVERETRVKGCSGAIGKVGVGSLLVSSGIGESEAEGERFESEGEAEVGVKGSSGRETVSSTASAGKEEASSSGEAEVEELGEAGAEAVCVEEEGSRSRDSYQTGETVRLFCCALSVDVAGRENDGNKS